MIPQRSITLLARTALVPITTLAVVGVGGGIGPASASTPSRAAGAKPKAAVHVTKTDLGKTLVDAQGRTVYMFSADSGTTERVHRARASPRGRRSWPRAPRRSDRARRPS